MADPSSHSHAATHSNGSQQQAPAASSTSLGFTGVSTNDRFQRLTRQTRDFVPSEDISIGIERNIRGEAPAVIPRILQPQHFELKRRKDEGERKLHERDEFQTRDEPSESEAEEEEVRRTVKIVSSGADSKSKSSKSRIDADAGEPEVK